MRVIQLDTSMAIGTAAFSDIAGDLRYEQVDENTIGTATLMGTARRTSN
jgi:hypothetical protein